MGKITDGTEMVAEPADDDVFPIVDVSEAVAANKRKKISWSTIKAIFALVAKGVTNGDSHDHSGGDGAQISHTTLSNNGTATGHVTNGDSHDHSGGDGGDIAHSSLTGLTGTWTTVTSFGDTWANYGGTYYSTAYYKDQHNFVHIRGLVAGGNTGSVVFILPTGYRPTATTLFPSVNSAAGSLSAGVISIDSSGNVAAFCTGSTYVTIDGITFYAG